MKTSSLLLMLGSIELQLELAEVEATVHSELRDEAAIDESSEVDVGGIFLLVGKRIEHVVGTERELCAPGDGNPEVDVEQRLGAEQLVVVAAAGVGIRLVADAPVVVAAHQGAPPAE